MLTRDQMHRLIDALPESQLGDASVVLEQLTDPLTRALLLAPEDDEPLTEEERTRIKAARAEAETVGYLAHEEVKRRHGL